MNDDNQRQEGATSPDTPRPAAASGDNEYSLSIEDVAALYEQAGLPRDRRTIQRYCAKGNLVCHRIEIPYGEKYLVTPASVATHIAYVKEVRQAAVSRGEPRPAAASEVTENVVIEKAATTDDTLRPATTSSDMSQHVAPQQEPVSQRVAASDEMMSRYVARIEGENEFLRGQVSVKDKQIGELTERARETNHLIGGLQKMLTPLLGGSERFRAPDQPEQP
jgi:hypothetical protein